MGSLAVTYSQNTKLERKGIIMKFIPTKYAVTDTASKPDGVPYKCRFCNREFIVPPNEAATMLFDKPNVCEDCKDQLEKEEALKAEADAKSDIAAKTESEIAAAVGN